MCAAVGKGRGWLGLGATHTNGITLPLHYHQSACISPSVCLSAYQSVRLSVARSNWSAAWRERLRSCEHSAGIRIVWHVQRWEAYPSAKDEEYMCLQDNRPGVYSHVSCCVRLHHTELHDKFSKAYMLTKGMYIFSSLTILSSSCSKR